MTILFPDYKNSDRAILLAITLSLMIHLLAILKLPNIEFEKKPLPETLVVEISPQQKATPIPKPEPLPEPVKPPSKREPIVKPRPAEQAPAPAVSHLPEPIISQPPPQVIAVAPKVDVQPTFVAPTPEPIKPPPPSTQDNEAGIAQYLRQIAPELAKNQHYPAIARSRGWTGVTKLEIHLDSTGKLLSSEIKETSGYPVLDKQALELVRKTTFPPPPEAVINRNIIIPINFDLKSE